MRPLLLCSLAIFLAACGDVREENFEIKVECNGEVLVDETFDSREECEEFVEENGPFVCSGIEAPVSC